MKWYRHGNKRLVPRAGSGRFRPTTLADIGMGACDQCNQTYCLADHEDIQNPNLDPRLFNAMKRLCPSCLKGA